MHLCQFEIFGACMRHSKSEPDKTMAAVQAAEAAKEAREWISNWREGKTKGMTARPPVYCT